MLLAGRSWIERWIRDREEVSSADSSAHQAPDDFSLRLRPPLPPRSVVCSPSAAHHSPPIHTLYPSLPSLSPPSLDHHHGAYSTRRGGHHVVDDVGVDLARRRATVLHLHQHHAGLQRHHRRLVEQWLLLRRASRAALVLALDPSLDRLRRQEPRRLHGALLPSSLGSGRCRLRLGHVAVRRRHRRQCLAQPQRLLLHRPAAAIQRPRVVAERQSLVAARRSLLPVGLYAVGRRAEEHARLVLGAGLVDSMP